MVSRSLRGALNFASIMPRGMRLSESGSIVFQPIGWRVLVAHIDQRNIDFYRQKKNSLHQTKFRLEPNQSEKIIFPIKLFFIGEQKETTSH